MSNEDVLYDLLVSQTEARAIVDAPLDAIDLADWALNLPDAEYQRCAPGEHIAAGRTTTDDGRPMSINVENIGGTLVIQHYIAEIHEPHHCKLVSLTDAQTSGGWIKVQATWDMRVERVDDATCEFVNTVTTRPTQGYLDFVAQTGATFEEAAAAQHAVIVGHNGRETPLFAASISRKAKAALPST